MFKQISAPRTKQGIYDACEKIRTLINRGTRVSVCLRTPVAQVGRPVFDVSKRRRWFEVTNDSNQMTFNFDSFRPKPVNYVGRFTGGFELRLDECYYLVYRDFKGRPEDGVVTGLEVYVNGPSPDDIQHSENVRLRVVGDRPYTSRHDIQAITGTRVMRELVWSGAVRDITAITFMWNSAPRYYTIDIETQHGSRRMPIDSSTFNREFEYVRHETNSPFTETGRTRWSVESIASFGDFCRSAGQYSVAVPRVPGHIGGERL